MSFEAPSPELASAVETPEASARPLLRPALGWMIGVPALAVAVACAFALAPFLGRRRAFWTMAPGYIRMMAALFGIRRSLAGWEALPEEIQRGEQPVVFIANHQSHLDPPLLISTLPSHPVFLAKRELAYVPFLGWVIWLAGFIFVDRLDRARAVASVEDAASRIRQGQSVVVFPEGTRGRHGRLLPFKKGSFTLALKAGVPIIPLAIQGGADILPRGDWRVRGDVYRLQVGTPLDPSDFSDAEHLKNEAESRLADLLRTHEAHS
jgi:1-acyl-sn-glycerol-3-phosphate acyltransferase